MTKTLTTTPPFTLLFTPYLMAALAIVFAATED